MSNELLHTENDLILDIQNLHVQYKTFDSLVYAVNGVDLQLKRGATLGLVGETGAGKTTTGLSVIRLVQKPQGRITDGQILFNGKSILDMSDKELRGIRGRKISMIFQDPMTSLNPVTTVEQQIAEVIMQHNKIDKATAIMEAQKMLEMVGIPAARGKEYPHQFSGGMKQRVIIAIALACTPELLIADEPTTALDVTIQAQVLEMIRELREKNNTSMIMITHDLGIVAEICTEVSVIYGGRVVEHGTLEDIFDHDLHPYTQGLFDSLPDLDNRQAKLKPIKGMMPDPTIKPTGCTFAPRCEYATERCYQEAPQKVYRNEEHFVECHLYTDDEIVESKVRK